MSIQFIRPKKIGQYVYDMAKKLGKGTYGQVFLCKRQVGEGDGGPGINGSNNSNTPHRQPQQLLAVKIIPKQLVKNDNYLMKAIMTQIQLMQCLKHPNTVQFIECVQSGKNIYIIMEFCTGGSLGDVIKRGKLNDGQAYQVMRQIVSGYSELMKNNIVHRDLKPDNILISTPTTTTTGNTTTLGTKLYKIADFGLSKSIDPSSAILTCAGSPLYMAPQILQKQSYTSKCDVWSLGVIYYHILHGSPPYVCKNIQQLKERIKNSKIVYKCGEKTQKIIGHMLEVRVGWKQKWIRWMERDIYLFINMFYEYIYWHYYHLLQASQSKRASFNDLFNYFQVVPYNSNSNLSDNSNINPYKRINTPNQVGLQQQQPQYPPPIVSNNNYGYGISNASNPTNNNNNNIPTVNNLPINNNPSTLSNPPSPTNPPTNPLPTRTPLTIYKSILPYLDQLQWRIYCAIRLNIAKNHLISTNISKISTQKLIYLLLVSVRIAYQIDQNVIMGLYRVGESGMDNNNNNNNNNMKYNQQKSFIDKLLNDIIRQAKQNCHKIQHPLLEYQGLIQLYSGSGVGNNNNNSKNNFVMIEKAQSKGDNGRTVQLGNIGFNNISYFNPILFLSHFIIIHSLIIPFLEQLTITIHNLSGQLSNQINVSQSIDTKKILLQFYNTLLSLLVVNGQIMGEYIRISSMGGNSNQNYYGGNSNQNYYSSNMNSQHIKNIIHVMGCSHIPNAYKKECQQANISNNNNNTNNNTNNNMNNNTNMNNNSTINNINFIKQQVGQKIKIIKTQKIYRFFSKILE